MPLAELAGRVAELSGKIAAAAKTGGHGQRVRIVAVTKTHPVEAVEAAVAAGLPDIGENKVQEALAKQAVCSVKARWHLIGHLQRNKVRQLHSFHLFHALDSPRLADAIERQFEGCESPFPVLLEVNISGEGTKGGYSTADLKREADRLMTFRHLAVSGVMTMAPLDAGESQLRQVFAGAREARDVLLAAGHNAVELSMGMSQDFLVAVEEGATMVRLGTVLFGERAQ